jgi:hypothetical protein
MPIQLRDCSYLREEGNFMKSARLAIVATIVAWLLFALAPVVWAGGGPAGETPCCQVTKPGVDAVKLKGTMAIVYDPNGTGSTPNLDVILRLEKRQTQTVGFFRINLNGLGASLTGKTNEEIACLILNPYENAFWPPEIRARLYSFVASILDAFVELLPGATPDNTRLVIKENCISNMQGYLECEDPNVDPPDPGNVRLCLIPGTARVSSIGDIVIYAIDIERFHKINPICE